MTLFKGIFYHLPDPVTGLKLAADLTDEVLIVNTATKAGFPDGLLVPDHEAPERLMSGTSDLCWYPTGPQLLAGILGWLGFAEVRCSIWRHAPRQRGDLDRLEVIASRTPGFFAAWDAAGPEGPARARELIERYPRAGAKVATLGPEPEEPSGRQTVQFPGGADQTDEDALAHLDRLRGEGGFSSRSSATGSTGWVPTRGLRAGSRSGAGSPTWRSAASMPSRSPGERAPQLVPG